MPGQRRRRREAGKPGGPRLPTCPTAAGGGWRPGWPPRPRPCRGTKWWPAPCAAAAQTWPGSWARTSTSRQRCAAQVRAALPAHSRRPRCPCPWPCVPAAFVPEPDWDKLELIVVRLPQGPYQRSPAAGPGRWLSASPPPGALGVGALLIPLIPWITGRERRLGAAGQPRPPPRPCFASARAPGWGSGATLDCKRRYAPRPGLQGPIPPCLCDPALCNGSTDSGADI